MTTIVVCADHGTPIPEGVADSHVVAVDDLCARPRQLELVVSPDETSVLLALHGSEFDLGRVQAALRHMGFDPLGVGMLDLERVVDGAIEVGLAALAARTACYPGSRPEQVKLLRSTRTTRRAFLAPGPPSYTGAPRIDETCCVAGDGCRTCVDACPVDALSWSGGAIDYDKSTCMTCGVCLTTCPTGAVVNPIATPAALEAEIRTVLSDVSEPIGIRFVCRMGHVAAEPGWYQVEVPCTGMLTVGWLLAPLALGASAVSSVTCEASGCRAGLSRRTVATQEDAATVLVAMGIDPARLDGRSNDFARLHASSEPVLGAGSTQRVIAHLHQHSTSVPGFVALDHGDVGTIEIDVSACTACVMCASVCPTDALGSSHDPDAVRIDFDPRSCVACGQCIKVCPEIDRGAIRLTRGFDPGDWQHGRRELRNEPTARCELCGKPVAPAAMLDRISGLLGDEHAGTLALIGKRCIDCRGR